MGFLSSITDAIGLTNTKGEKAAAANAAAANAQSLALSKEQIALMKEELDFQKDQYNDWKEIYGDLQENLGDYYKNLDTEDITAMGLTQQQRAYQEATKLIETEAAQRNISGGVVDSELLRAGVGNAEARATIRATAPDVVEAKKMGFLGLGLGQGTQMLGTIAQAGSNANQAFTTGVNSRTNIANNFLNQQTTLSSNNTNAMGQIVGAGMGWASGGASMGYK